jgi:hypothetical protein
MTNFLFSVITGLHYWVKANYFDGFVIGSLLSVLVGQILFLTLLFSTDGDFLERLVRGIAIALVGIALAAAWPAIFWLVLAFLPALVLYGLYCFHKWIRNF